MILGYLKERIKNKRNRTKGWVGESKQLISSTIFYMKRESDLLQDVSEVAPECAEWESDLLQDVSEVGGWIAPECAECSNYNEWACDFPKHDEIYCKSNDCRYFDKKKINYTCQNCLHNLKCINKWTHGMIENLKLDNVDNVCENFKYQPTEFIKKHEMYIP